MCSFHTFLVLAGSVFFILEVINMTTFTFPVKSFKRFDDPFDNGRSRTKYRFYVEIKDVPCGLLDWMETNPREQNLKTDVSKEIDQSLRADNHSFHLWNRGMLFSAEEVLYDNKSKLATLSFSDKSIHGNIDGGHTLRIITQYNSERKNDEEPNYYCQYVEFEVVTGLDSTVLIAEARNTSTQVDTTSIEELKQSFDCIKCIIDGQTIKNDKYIRRISFKQNQHHDDSDIKNIIDVRELISIINMFSPTLYPKGGNHPIQSYTGKETSLNKFLNMGHNKTENESIRKTAREDEVRKMSNIIPDIIKLWDEIECELPNITKQMNKRYGRKPYSGYREDDKNKPMVVGHSKFSNTALFYLVPNGLLYPLVGSFRALVDYNNETDMYEWIENPFKVWEELKEKLIDSILNSSNEQNDNPNAVGKSISAWDGVYTKVYIYSLEKKVNK